MRDDFSKKTKDKLAKRVGFHCSLCDVVTAGPSEETYDGTLITGVAAHICAASPGGPRYDASMTADERSDFNNGIWLCQNCGHLIDSDTVTYSVDTLYQIKTEAEKRAHLRIATNGQCESACLNISITTKNQMISDINIMIQGARNLRSLISTNYQLAIIPGNDTIVYNVCVSIYNACSRLRYTESENHLQLKALKLDKRINKLCEMTPSFYDAQGDWTGTQMIATNSDYVKFFCTEDGDGEKFIKKCEKLINIIENI